MKNNYGFQNEYDFVELFNDKFYKDFGERNQKFLKELFGDIMDNTEKIISWKNKCNQKADIFIRYKNYVKRISLKCGNSNSIHSEQIQEFKMYLEKLNIPYKVIDKYMSYHYGYKKDENGNTDFSKMFNSEEYKSLYQSEINVFNESINKTKIIIDMIDRFIIRGRNSDYDIDALISGTVDDYVWIMKYDIYDLILSKRCLDFTSPHIACITLGPKKRCISSDRNIKDRYIVCARWNYMRKDIENFYNSR